MNVNRECKPGYSGSGWIFNSKVDLLGLLCRLKERQLRVNSRYDQIV